MKKNFLIAFIMITMIIPKIMQAQEVVPDYGITKYGIIFIREDVVDRLCTAGDKISVCGNWNGDKNWVGWTEMTLMDYKGTGVYVYDAGKKINGTRIICFQLNESCYYPKVAMDKNDPSYIENDVISNDDGSGKNLKIKACDLTFN